MGDFNCIMDAIVISDDENESDDEPISVKIERLQRKRPGSPIVIDSDDDEKSRPGSSRCSTDREVSPADFDMDRVRLPSSDDELDDDNLFDSALDLRRPNNMIPGSFINYFLC